MGSRVSLPKGSRAISVAMGLLVALSVAGWGHGCSKGGTSVSSGLFLAPTAKAGGIRVLANKIRFLKAIEPTKLESDLASIPTDSFILGHLSVWDDMGASVSQSPDLLVYENQSRSVESVNSCPEGTSTSDCGSVKLNYNARGLDDTQSSQGSITQGGVISSTVPAIKLKGNGWILTYDSGSRNLVAFREETPRILGDGSTLGYRTFPSDATKANKNFGYGNGLVMSLVISGENLAREIHATSEPIVTRIFELEENKVLLFFSTVRAVHLLELSEEETPLSFDLNDPDNPDKRLPVRLLRGTVKLFPDPLGGDVGVPFLAFRTISENITGNDNVKIDAFQPIIDPSDGAALVFEQTTSEFLDIFALKELVDDPDNPGEQIEAIVGGGVDRATLPGKLISVLQQGVGGNVVSPPLDFREGFYHVSSTEICLFEEKTNNLLAYDYEKGIANNLRIFVPAADFLQPRGGSGAVIGTEPIMTWAIRDVNDNRLGFDQGLDQLLSVSYSAGAVVVVADRLAITAVTNNTLAAINYVEPLTNTEVRAFDNQSNSLLAITLDYATLPVKVK